MSSSDSKPIGHVECLFVQFDSHIVSCVQDSQVRNKTTFFAVWVENNTVNEDVASISSLGSK
jgi:hypothetical protein